MSRASRATASTAPRTGMGTRSKSWTPAASSPMTKPASPAEILRQAKVAIENATRVVHVVDGRSGPVPLDAELAQLLRRAGKPPVIAVNKVDMPNQVAMAAPFYELSDEVFPDFLRARLRHRRASRFAHR